MTFERKSAICAYGLCAALVLFIASKTGTTHPELRPHVEAFPALGHVIAGVTVLFAACLGRRHRRHFGRAGRWGLMRSYLATTDIAVLTAAAMGVLVMPLAGAMYGPLALGLTLADHPVMLLLIASAATLGHVTMGAARGDSVNP